jgi:AraC-like DNA-binding protein
MNETGYDQKSALQEEPPGEGEVARLWRPASFPDLECIAASFTTHRYAPHRHDTFVIGVNLSGVELFDARGGRHAAAAGQIMVLNPDELHDGRALGSHYRYRAFYPTAAMLRGIVAELRGDPGAGCEPVFDELVIDDAPLAARLVALHRLLQDGGDPLAADEALVDAFGHALMRHGSIAPSAPAAGREPRAVARVLERIDAAPEHPASLDELAAIAGLSRFHFLRVFRRATGQTPHAYLVMRRVNRARSLLAAGEPPAEVAAACGFSDQSHLNRVFKRFVGTTPGAYARAMRPGRAR